MVHARPRPIICTIFVCSSARSSTVRKIHRPFPSIFVGLPDCALGQSDLASDRPRYLTSQREGNPESSSCIESESVIEMCLNPSVRPTHKAPISQCEESGLRIEGKIGSWTLRIMEWTRSLDLGRGEAAASHLGRGQSGSICVLGKHLDNQ
jgi:hypothetical protein